MKASELNDKIRRYYWLKKLAEDYDNDLFRLSKEGNAVSVEFIGFRCRSDRTERFDLNCHKTISPAPFIKAIKQCLKEVREEMVALRAEIETKVELD